MANRSMLKAQLRHAWQHTIEHHYQRQHINSEHGLQAYLCAALLNRFQHDGVADSRRVFIEPTLTVGQSNVVRRPDILICNTRSIIGVVELKYKPKGRARTRKDLETLDWMATHSQGVTVQNDQYLAIPRDGRSYQLSDDAVLCWAGVHKAMPHPIVQHVKPQLHNYFMELHAITSPDADPKIIMV